MTPPRLPQWNVSETEKCVLPIGIRIEIPRITLARQNIWWGPKVGQLFDPIVDQQLNTVGSKSESNLGCKH